MRDERGRRRFLGVALGAVAAAVPLSSARGQGRARPTPACGEHGLTPPQTEGPYFKPKSPARTSLVEPGMPGTRLVVEGAVLTSGCTPIPNAIVDVWQCDDRGQYDNSGYRLRGHQAADGAGRYRFETIVPGVYPGRTRHIHVIVAAPGRRPLTTQLYFPGEPGNQRDGIYVPELVMKLADEGAGRRGTFDFILDVRSA